MVTTVDEHMRAPLEEGLTALGITPPPGAVEALLLYARRLLEQNQVMNLTAITDPLGVCELHFLDSAALITQVRLEDSTLIDVGTGAGFPGLVLKLLVPSLRLTLLDSLGKRVTWLEGLCQELGLADVTCLHGRAEEAGHNPALREQFRWATARAVAALPVLSELCLPFVAPGGAFLALKSEHSEGELSDASALLPLLGGGTPRSMDYTLPLTGVPRRLIEIPKLAGTPSQYPRKWSKIKRG
jgi:16S rRNA (guanine527-N7)-methyltransferase